MGQMQFIVPDRSRLPEGATELAYFAGHEESPQVTRAVWENGLLVISRQEQESGTLTIPWKPSPSADATALATATLIERPRPYLLPLELARGAVYRLRSYAFLWQSFGLAAPDELGSLLQEARTQLARAATSQSDAARAAAHADQALDAALRAGEILCRAYGDQWSAARKSLAPRPPFLVGATLDARPPDQPFAEHLLQACNTLGVPFDWPEVERVEGSPDWQLSESQLAWCQAHELSVCGGPLLRCARGALPAWLDASGDFELLLARATRHLQGVVERFRGRVQLWNCAAGANTARGLGLSEDQQLRLAVRAVETVRVTDGNAPVIISLDQPWGDYLRDERRQLSPIHFADALLRGNLGLSGLGLRIDIGLSPETTLPRDVLEISRQIDRWSVFNLPLLVELTLPPSRSFAAASELAWLKQVVPVLLSKATVQAVFWGQLFDGQSGQLPDRGLFDTDATPKPALEAFANVRRMAE
jgi:hypothetical protein